MYTNSFVVAYVHHNTTSVFFAYEPSSTYHAYSLNTRQLVRTRGELAHTNLDTGVVLGENGSGTAIVNQIDLPLTSVSTVSMCKNKTSALLFTPEHSVLQMVFAEGPSRTQLAEGEFEDKLVQEKDAAKGIMMV